MLCEQGARALRGLSVLGLPPASHLVEAYMKVGGSHTGQGGMAIP